jgi:hypothetical protein
MQLWKQKAAVPVCSDTWNLEVINAVVINLMGHRRKGPVFAMAEQIIAKAVAQVAAKYRTLLTQTLHGAAQ